LAAPGLAGAAAHGRVLPDIAVAREVRRLDGERVVHDRQIGLVGGRPEGLEVGVVDRHPLGQQGPDCGDPVLARVLLDHLRAPGGVGGQREDHALQAPRVGCTVVRHVPVIGAIEAPGQMRGQGGSAIGPRPGNDEVDVPALPIHVAQAALPVVLGHPRSDRLPRDHAGPAGEEATVATARGGGCRRLFSGHPLQADRLD
jgi:hypothetical protein